MRRWELLTILTSQPLLSVDAVERVGLRSILEDQNVNLQPEGIHPSVAAEGQAPRSSHSGAIAAVIIIVLVLVVVLYLFSTGAFTPNSPNSIGNPTQHVTVTAINYQFTGASCTGWSDFSDSGPTVNAGQQFSDSFSLHNGAILGTCTAQSVSVSTSGFSVISSNAPLTVNAGSSQTLSITYGTPSTSFNGAITVVISVTTAI